MSGRLEDVGPPRTPISLRTVIGGKYLREPPFIILRHSQTRCSCPGCASVT